MRAVVFCEGTTDLLMIQCVFQYRYGWQYKGFVENSVTNRLIKRILIKDDSIVEIRSCGGIMNIPKEMKKLQEHLEYATKSEELFDIVILLIDHDTDDSNKEFISQFNENLGTNFHEEDINNKLVWKIDNTVLGEQDVKLFIRCLPESETGAIESVMLKALSTDDVEENLIKDSRNFITSMSQKQTKYLQKKALISKAIFNTYFAIRTPEEKYDERARILKAYNWKSNEVINNSFSFLNILGE